MHVLKANEGPAISPDRIPVCDPWPARLDVVQGISGAVLVLFMWVHMFLVASILLGNDAMFLVTRMLEGDYLFGRPYPALVSAIAVTVLGLFLIHALVAIWKMPGSYREYRAFWIHIRRFRHPDSTLWLLQVATGLVLMFTVTVHLYEMIMQPGDIGPYASADRVVSGGMWLLDFIMIFAVELHAGIGVYRLIMKWDLFGATRTQARRKLARRAIAAIVAFYLLLGSLTFAAYVKIGLEHRGAAGERYVPTWQQDGG